MAGHNCHSSEKRIATRYDEQPLTRKFYARHDVTSTRVQDRVLAHEAHIEKRLGHDLRRKRYTPLTSNQVYGWLEHCAVHVVPTDQQTLQRLQYRRATSNELRLQSRVWQASLNSQFAKR